MSTIFALFKFPPFLDENGIAIQEVDYINYVEVAKRVSGDIFWLGDFEIIAEHLSDETRVYAVDNTPQNIYTIGDIKKQINKT
jgi:hypothetical protein